MRNWLTRLEAEKSMCRLEAQESPEFCVQVIRICSHHWMSVRAGWLPVEPGITQLDKNSRRLRKASIQTQKPRARSANCVPAPGSKFALPLPFCSFQALLDWMVPTALVRAIIFIQCLPIQMLISHRNTLTTHPKKMFYQLSEHP